MYIFSKIVLSLSGLRSMAPLPLSVLPRTARPKPARHTFGFLAKESQRCQGANETPPRCQAFTMFRHWRIACQAIAPVAATQLQVDCSQPVYDLVQS